jgi:hypothetical protein
MRLAFATMADNQDSDFNGNDQAIIKRANLPLRAVDVGRIEKLFLHALTSEDVSLDQIDILRRSLRESCQLRGLEPRAEPEAGVR